MTQPQWLTKLHTALQRLRLPVREVVAGDGRLHITLGDTQASLAAIVRPAQSGGTGWGATDRFILAYEGAGDVGPEQERWLSAVLHILRKGGHTLPPALDEACGIFSPETPPEERFLRLYSFCTVERSQIGGGLHTEILIRTTTRCNQACPFCSAPEHATPSAKTVAACIGDAANAFSAASLSLTGGEPTLRRTFADEVHQALGLSQIEQVQIQTNAVAFAKKYQAADFPTDGRLRFFVSLHALDEALYNECTGSQGQLPLALDGIKNLINAGHYVTVNCVINSINIEHLSDYIRALPDTLPFGERVDLHFSTLLCHENRPEAPKFLARYPRVAEVLEEVVAAGRAKGITIESLRASTHAAIPACMLAPRYREHRAHRPVIQAWETGYEDYTRPFVKAARCKDCVETPTCLGVPTPYAQLFGLDELSPFGRE